MDATARAMATTNSSAPTVRPRADNPRNRRTPAPERKAVIARIERAAVSPASPMMMALSASASHQRSRNSPNAS